MSPGVSPGIKEPWSPSRTSSSRGVPPGPQSILFCFASSTVVVSIFVVPNGRLLLLVDSSAKSVDSYHERIDLAFLAYLLPKTTLGRSLFDYLFVADSSGLYEGTDTCIFHCI